MGLATVKYVVRGPRRTRVIVAVVSAGGHFVSKWQPRVLATTICSKVAADSVGGRFGPN